MEKNSPLLYRDAFDTYKAEYFECRKTEDFPKLLYESYVETSE